MNHQAANLNQQIQQNLTKTNQLINQPTNQPTTRLITQIQQNLKTLAQHPQAPTQIATLNHLTKQATRLIDLPPDKRLIGNCYCGTRLYGDPTKPTTTCPNCHTNWDTQQRLTDLEQQCRDLRLTPKEVQIATSGRIKATRIRKWIQRHRINADQHGRIRFAEALQLEQHTPENT